MLFYFYTYFWFYPHTFLERRYTLIHTLTLNPAIDRILYLPQFQQNITNRTTGHIDTIGGKGTHVSISLNILGLSSTAIGICHGDTGHRIIDMLSSHHIHVRFNHYDTGETRTNYLLIEDTGDCTIIAEQGVQLSEEELTQLIDTMTTEIHPNDFLILSGDASNSPDASIYNRIINRLHGRHLKIFLDTSGDSLKECLLESPYMIKPNLDELSSLCKKEVLENDEDIINAIHSLDAYHIPIIAVSLGGEGSLIKTPDGFYRAYPPKVNVINTIGCGDCFLAGFIYGVSKNLSMLDTIQIATAVSAATAESNLSVGYSYDRAMELKDQVIVKKLNF